MGTIEEHVDYVEFDSDVNFITLPLETSWLTLLNIRICFDGPRHINISFSDNGDPIEGVHSSIDGKYLTSCLLNITYTNCHNLYLSVCNTVECDLTDCYPNFLSCFSVIHYHIFCSDQLKMDEKVVGNFSDMPRRINHTYLRYVSITVVLG